MIAFENVKKINLGQKCRGKTNIKRKESMRRE